MKIIIKNRKNQNIIVELEKSENQTGLVFIEHGLSASKDKAHIIAYAEVFKSKNFTVVRFDTTNTFGESDGSYADATVTNYYEDLEDVIKWASQEGWYEEPFWLVGHSLGAISSALYAEKYPDKVKALAPTSSVISGELSLTIPKYNNWEEMKERGWIEEKNGIKLNSNHIIDRLKYDLLRDADKLTMPVLLMVGSQDESTPLKHQKLLFNKLGGEKRLEVIEGAPHSFKDPEHLKKIKEIFSDWIDLII